MHLDNVEIAFVSAFLICSAVTIALGGKRAVIGVGMIAAILMALGGFPPHHAVPVTISKDDGEPLTDADRTRAKELEAEEPRVLERGTVTVRMPDGRVVTVRTRRISD